MPSQLLPSLAIRFHDLEDDGRYNKFLITTYVEHGCFLWMSLFFSRPSVSYQYRQLPLPFRINSEQLRNRILMNLIYLSNVYYILRMTRGKITFAWYRRILHSWQKFLVRVCFLFLVRCRKRFQGNLLQEDLAEPPQRISLPMTYLWFLESRSRFWYGRTPFTANLSGSNNLHNCSP